MHQLARVVITRTDRFDGADEESVETTWCIERWQNQRAQTQLNLLIEVVRIAAV